MTVGQPLKFDTVLPNGKTVAQNIAERVEAIGCAPTLCAGDTGVSRESIRHWMDRGRTVAEGIAEGRKLREYTYNDRRCWRFFCDTTAAHARYEQGLHALHAQLERGGRLITQPDGTVVPQGLYVEKIVTKHTPDGVETTRTVEVKMPDRQAIEWALERKGSENYRPRVEVTGADGAPLHPAVPARSDDEQWADMERALDAYARGHQAGVDDERARTRDDADA